MLESRELRCHCQRVDLSRTRSPVIDKAPLKNCTRRSPPECAIVAKPWQQYKDWNDGKDSRLTNPNAGAAPIFDPFPTGSSRLRQSGARSTM
jgi:hypothetical protein